MTNRVSGRNMEDMEAMMLPNAIGQLRVFSGKKILSIFLYQLHKSEVVISLSRVLNLTDDQ